MSILTTIEGEASSALTTFLGSFITSDIGTLVTDAINYAATNADSSGDDKREAAKAKLIADAELAGKDLLSESQAVLNFLIEAGLQALTAGAIAAV